MICLRCLLCTAFVLFLLFARDETCWAAIAMDDISSPVVVRQSPENESVIVKLSDATSRIFYTLQPSGAELRSITSRDGGLFWSDDRLEVATDQARLLIKRISMDPGL